LAAAAITHITIKANTSIPMTIFISG